MIFLLKAGPHCLEADGNVIKLRNLFLIFKTSTLSLFLEGPQILPFPKVLLSTLLAGASVVLGLYGHNDITPHHRAIGLSQFGLEFLLAYMIVLAYLRVTDSAHDISDKSLNPAISVGVAYMAALVAYKVKYSQAIY